MRLSIKFLSVFALALGVIGETTPMVQEGTGPVDPSTPSYTKGPDPGRVNHEVSVAKVSHKFHPETVTAQIGDTITFLFYPQKHSAVLTDFQSPCVPWSSFHIGEADTWSGLITQTEAVKNPPTWTWRVDTMDPRFFYCSGPASCAGWGMVFVVNPSAEQTLEDFRSRAVAADYQLSPGQSPPPEGGSTTPTTTSSHKGLSTGAIVGIVIGAIGAVAAVGLLFFLIGRSRRKSASEKAAAASVAQQPVVDAGPVPGTYGDHPPPQYYGQPVQPAAWEGKSGLAVPNPPLSPNPSQYNPHASMYGSPDFSRGGHTSWAPSELGGESAQQAQRVEIYTPGVDDRIPLNSPPKAP